MVAYLIRRSGYSLLVIAGVLTLVFVLTHVVGDPARAALPLSASQEDYERLRQALGLDQPLWTQYGDFVKGAVQLDFGESTWYHVPAVDLVLSRMPATILLAFTSLGLALVVSVPLGIVAGMRPGGWVDRFASGFSIVGQSIPNFVLGIGLVLLLSVYAKLLPTSGYGSLQQLVLPAVTLAVLEAARLTQIVRSASLQEATRAYVLTARSKGASERRIARKHVLRNAAPTIVNLSGWELIRLLAGYPVAVEVVFGWPGIGNLFAEAVVRQDVPVVLAGVVVAALVVVLVNLVVDVVQALIDPRIRLA